MRLRTKLILSYFLVVLIAVVVLGALALPLLQSYQNDKAKVSLQNQQNETANLLNNITTLINADVAQNPFRDYICGGTKKSCKDTKPPTQEELQAGFQRILLGKPVRLLLTETSAAERVILFDTEPDRNRQLTGQVLNQTSPSLPTRNNQPTPVPDVLIGSRPYFYLEMNLPQQGPYQLVLSQTGTPNLFGLLNNQGNPRPLLLVGMFPTPAVPKVIGDFSPILGIAGLFALVVSLIVGLFLSRSISRPLIKATEASQAVARGDYNHSLPPEGGYELSQLAQSFNQMIAEVEKSQRLQRELIGNVSHELKTPLTAILGFSQAMVDGVLRKPEDFQRPAEIIHNETERMIRLVNSLLDLSKLESGQIKLAMEEIDPGQIIERSLGNFETLGRERQVKLVRQFEGMAPVIGDKDRLQQVFNNLVDNALRYTPAGGSITISSRIAFPNLIIKVSDTGQGISPEDLPHVFERFYQADKSRSKESGGLGLGLALSKEIINGHHGKIEVSSAPGSGTTFTISLPLSTSARDQMTTTRFQIPDSAVTR